MRDIEIQHMIPEVPEILHIKLYHYITRITTPTILLMTKISLCMQYRGNISLRFSRNPEADASEILENLEEMS